MSLLSRFVGFLRGDPPPSVQPHDEARPAPDSAAAPADDLPRGIGVGRWLNIWERSWPDDAAANGRCVEQVAFARDDDAIHVALLGNPAGHPALRGREVAPGDVNGAGMALLPGVLARFESKPEAVSLVRMISDNESLVRRWLEEAAGEGCGWTPIAASMAFAREDSAAPMLFVLAGQREGACALLRLACHPPGEIPPAAYAEDAPHWVDAGTARLWPAAFDRQRPGWIGFLATALEDRAHTYLLGYRYARKDVPPQWPWALDANVEEIEFARREWLDVELIRGLDGDELGTNVLQRSGTRCIVRALHYWRVHNSGSTKAYSLHRESLLAYLELGEDLVELLTAIRTVEPRRAACAGVPLANWEPVGEAAATATGVLGFLTDGSVATLALLARSADGNWQPQSGTARLVVIASAISSTFSARWIDDLLHREDVLKTLATV